MLLDNKKTGKVGDVLKENLKNDSRLSIISGLFSIYGFEALKKELHHAESIRIIFSKMQQREDGVLSTSFDGLNGDGFERRFQNRLTQSHIARECFEWLSEKVEIKATNNPHILNQNLFHIENLNDESVAIQGSSNFTSSGLGYSESDNFDMNTCSSDSNSTKDLLGWFDSIWNNSDAVYETKELLLKHLDTIIKDNSPEFIYFLTLFNIFKEFLEELDEENIIKIKTGFKDTLIWNKLYKFQRDGVLGAIEKLEKYNGCIIADSVGLGKTFEALAVIK